MKGIHILILTLISSLVVSAQEEEKSTFGIKFSGFVKNDFFWDSRQTVSAREGHFFLWPSPVDLDDNGVDINGKTNFNFLAIQSRLAGKISGPDAFGAKTSALIEGDFFAQANANINLFRLRHAFMKLNWEHLEIMAGQYWNPLFVTSCIPGTVSFNTGTPLQSFARNPQIRISYKTGGLTLIAAALSQRDYTSIGMNGASTAYLRNSALPDMHMQIHFETNKESDFNILAGAGAAYKTIVPRLVNNLSAGAGRAALNEKVGGLTAILFTKITTGPLTVKLQGRYGENISDLLSISGFGVKEIIDPVSNEFSYTPLKSTTFWGEAHTNGNPQVGIFGGVLSNNGSKEAMDFMNVYGRSTNIRTLWKLVPRVVYNSGKVRLALEIEYTSAAYGSNYNEFYIPAETTTADNLRVLTAIYYFF
jgi:hypothetical protein